MNIDSAVSDQIADLIHEVAPNISLARSPKRVVVDEPEPVVLLEPQTIDKDRRVLIDELAAWATYIRTTFGRGVIMLADGEPLTYIDDMALDREPRQVVRSNFKLIFSQTPAMTSLALPTRDLVFVAGPALALDSFGGDLFPETTSFQHRGKTNVTRLFRPRFELGVTHRRASWQKWKIEYGQGLLPLDGITIRPPKNTSTPFASLTEELLQALLSAGETYA